ncbi:MAG TPA: hypothetical protein VF131_12120 [Blastocatellia bacterium]|nr:hypothetical protein [Blastocatellia bacterium]
MSRLMKTFLTATGLWLLAIFLTFTVRHSLTPLTGFGVLLFPLAGSALLVFSFVVLVKESKKLLPLLAIPLIISVCVMTFSKGLSWGPVAHFYLNRSYFEATVEKVLSAQDEAEKKKACQGDCWVMSASDNWIAFHYAHGFLNWHEIVYDPTGPIGNVKRDDFPARYRISTYFVYAEQITGNWYVCHFAD